MTRRGFLSLAAIAEPRTALARGADYLWRQQGKDGGWHSRTYGLLRSGQSLTPFALNALLRLPNAPQAGVGRAVRFILANTNRHGAVGMSEPDIPDFPNYSTALSVCALRRAGWEGWRPMVEYLRGQQFAQRNGWKPADAAFGAWGMGGEVRTPPDTGHVDLSMTRHVLEALRAGGVAVSDPAIQAARIYVERCQNPDGGFFFSTTEADTNKAGELGKLYRSYGTTTADGVLALVAAGYSRGDRRVVAATRWLREHHRGMAVAGFVGPAYDRWPEGLAFYYAAAVRAAVGVDVTGELERRQRADGSWSNAENLVKEDDPLIATPFAILAQIGG